MLLITIKYLRLCILFGFSTVAATAQSYCSLQVRIINEQGRPAPNVTVQVAEDEGRTTRVARHDGLVRFCGLGVGKVLVRVGSSSCRDIKMENVELEWQKTINMTVVYDDTVCNVDTLVGGPLTCSILLRFVAEDQTPLANVSLDPPVARSVPAVSDLAGRLMLTVPLGETIKSSTRLAGYAPTPIEQTCARDRRWRNQFVTLEKR